MATINMGWIDVNKKMLDKQIKDLLESNIPEDSKTGLHNLLGEIIDRIDDKQWLWDSIVKFEVNEIHEACQSLGNSCDWEFFEEELKTYTMDDMWELLKELEANK